MNNCIKIQLLQYLLNNNDFVPSSELQSFLHISRRSVINYIHDINQEHRGLIISSQRGYRITDHLLAQDLIQHENSYTASNYKERKSILLYRMILGNEIMEFDDIADSLFISSSTLHSDLIRLKRELKDAELSIKIKNNCLYLIGSEKAKRKYVTSLLNDELAQNHFNLDFLQNIFVNVNVKEVSSIITEVLEEEKVFLDDYSLLNYILHLSITMESLILSSSLDSDDSSISDWPNYTESVLRILKKIQLKLEHTYKIYIPFKKILDTSVLMSTRIVPKDFNQLSFNQAKRMMGKEIYDIVNEIVLRLQQIYGIDLRADNFMVRFSFHIKNLLQRLQENIVLPENNFMTIKDDYPFLYFIAQYISSLIHNNGYPMLNETEISYIALHLGILIEEKNANLKNLNCAIVIYDYYNMGKQLFNKLSSEINGLNLVTIVNSYDKLPQTEDIDLIITNLPIDPSVDIPSVKINLIPTQKDYLVLNKKIHELKSNLANKELIKKLKKLFKRELFYQDPPFNTHKDVIDTICSKMELLGYTDKNFITSIYTHEEIMSTAYHNIALPHSLDTGKDEIYESCISTVITKTPIDWSGSKVNFVFMLALRKDDRSFFKEVIDLLTSSLNDAYQQKRILESQNYDDFIANLIYSI